MHTFFEPTSLMSFERCGSQSKSTQFLHSTDLLCIHAFKHHVWQTVFCIGRCPAQDWRTTFVLRGNLSCGKRSDKGLKMKLLPATCMSLQNNPHDCSLATTFAVSRSCSKPWTIYLPMKRLRYAGQKIAPLDSPADRRQLWREKE